ncbi:hypothetical protein BDV38DRAFT_283534 [Aspergillus pseudotamarii]|uniref:Pre-rRNA processing protein n=1 Tax=Aspergillus pseudotamarii TaxID=132259 RepID=A0A5N6SQ89_ASPPS|nr:uncharacterized protein BDV38DRAFT_283534 [Aspergillus pseudotamarii]KAE8136858.1 hypothetical protein BDV38DRAFT_283534 [Aspergillus pseudotamarii]
MAEEASRPLLNKGSRPSSRPSSPTDKKQSSDSSPARLFELSSESTPLLFTREEDLATYGGVAPRRSSAASEDFLSANDTKKPRGRVRWPIFCVLLSLIGIIAILIFAFVAPAVVKQYAVDAIVFTPTNVSVESATADGIQARIQGDLVLDAGRIKKAPVRNIGRFATWIGREVETGQSEVEVYLPEYGNVLLGTASLPSIKVNIQNGHVNHVNFLADLVAGDIPGIRAVAVDWLEGRLGRLRVQGKATVPLKSGILSLGEQTITDSITFHEGDFPALPKVNVTKFNVHDTDTPGHNGAMEVDASVAALVDSPFGLNIPPLGFEVLVPNCSPGDPYISVADVTTKGFPIYPGQPTSVDVAGIVQGLSDDLTKTCPGKEKSPLDFLVKSYMEGLQTTVYVRGADVPSLGTPEWVVDILKTVTVPLAFTGHALDNLVKNFTMTDVHFDMPNPLAEPDTPESQPRVSALVNVLIGLPKQLNLLHLDVPRVRANSDIFYHGKKLGVLNLQEWQPANSTRLENVNGAPALLVNFSMKHAPIQVTDGDVLTDILQALLFEGQPVRLTVAASVDAEVSTGLGTYAVRGIPAEGAVNVKPPYGDSLERLSPRVESIALGPTTESSLVMKAKINITNPSPYSASVPFVDLILVYNETKVAHVTARDLVIVPGVNSGIHADLQWNPLELGGSAGVTAGQEMLSQYVSGYNTSVTIRSHEGTFPALPELGQALSRLGLEVPIPGVPVPGHPGDKDGKPKFIQDTTLHLWSSTAEFTLSSPFPNTTIEITSVEANAFYQKDEEVGSIDYYIPFLVPPGLSITPRLPVELNLNGIGYDALRKALGGTLKLDAVAKVGVLIRSYRTTITYYGQGITARVKI